MDQAPCCTAMRPAAELVNINENTSAVADGDAARSDGETSKKWKLLVKTARDASCSVAGSAGEAKLTSRTTGGQQRGTRAGGTASRADRRDGNDRACLQIVADSMDSAGREERRGLYFPVNSGDETAAKDGGACRSLQIPRLPADLGSLTANPPLNAGDVASCGGLAARQADGAGHGIETAKGSCAPRARVRREPGRRARS
jgi:hypothetical protein